MVKNPRTLRRFYKNLEIREHLPFRKALAIYEALHREAVSLGAIHSRNLLEGLEVSLRIAKILNSQPRERKKVPSRRKRA